MKEWFTASELADMKLPGIPTRRQNAARKARSENWRTRTVTPPNGGRPTAEFHVASLPEKARLELARRQAEEAASGKAAAERVKLADKIEQRERERHFQEGMAKAAQLDAAGRARMDARLALLDAFAKFERQAGLSTTRARRSFCTLYNAGEVEVARPVR